MSKKKKEEEEEEKKNIITRSKVALSRLDSTWVNTSSLVQRTWLCNNHWHEFACDQECIRTLLLWLMERERELATLELEEEQ